MVSNLTLNSNTIQKWERDSNLIIQKKSLNFGVIFNESFYDMLISS